MPIRISQDLPAYQILQNENIFVMTHDRAEQQDIRPLKILILNIMPKKIETYEAIISGECRGEDSDSSWTSKKVVKRCHKYEKEHK